MGTCHVVPKLDIEMLLLNLAQAQNIFTITQKSAHNKRKFAILVRLLNLRNKENIVIDMYLTLTNNERDRYCVWVWEGVMVGV